MSVAARQSRRPLLGDVRIRLRGIEPDDWTAFMRIAEDEEGLGDLLNPSRSAEGFRAWAKEQASAKSDGDGFQLAIEAVDTGELVGAVGSHHADPRAGWFEYGVTIGADHRRKGYAAEAVTLVLRFMFAERRYHKCEARISVHRWCFIVDWALSRRAASAIACSSLADTAISS
ncbi:GNAT family N-acetyltransferase [Streptomyces monashensis]|uniref:GNAT family N-acetyltransferase n=1 Tax=Streptomyces monashensis TaxID=1678012 RepID=UPI001FE3629B|nr:GNAT family N-acetyltransferase [Streptomyces monashensis]